MRKETVLIWIVAALVLFAIGYVGAFAYRDYQNQQLRDQPAPSLPVITN